MSGTADLLIVGASTRAAAQSARRAGRQPRCLDFFADRDLAAICNVDRVDCRAGGAEFERAATRLPPTPWIYTGPVENHPDRVDRISRVHCLCGNAGEMLRDVRDPFRVAGVLRRHGHPHPRSHAEARGLARDGSWLVKPLASAGGRHVQLWTTATSLQGEPVYFQQFLDGPTYSALYLATPGKCEFIGVTRQLIGAPASPFAYRGNIGPLAKPLPHVSRLRQLGEDLHAAFGLIGLFGIDYIEHADEPWFVEINPRYTASVEIFEIATQRSLLADHLRACGVDSGLARSHSQLNDGARHGSVVGKAVIYARRNLKVPEIPIDVTHSDSLFAVPGVADIPWPGSVVASGEPILTIFATGQDENECAEQLDDLEVSWRNRLNA